MNKNLNHNRNNIKNINNRRLFIYSNNRAFKTLNNKINRIEAQNKTLRNKIITVNNKPTVFTNNQNIKKLRRMNNNKLFYLSNPMLAVKEMRLFSIYSSSERVIHRGYYNYNVLSFEVGNNYTLSWTPNGAGFKRMLDDTPAAYLIANTGPVNLGHPDSFTTIMYTTVDNNLNPQTEINFVKEAFVDIPGRYRIVGATMKITNITPVVNKCGNVFTASYVGEGATNVYFLSTYPFASTQNYGNSGLPPMTFTYLKDNNFSNNLFNLSSKNSFSAAEKPILLNFINVGPSANNFSNYNEYLQVPYNSTHGFGSWSCGCIGPSIIDTGKPNQPQAIGNNVVFNVYFSGMTEPQNFSIETFYNIEIQPIGSSTFNSLAKPSRSKVSDRQERILLAKSKLMTLSN
jgi:hypothetical protein